MVYCDIPYIGTSTGRQKEYGESFDYEAFYRWARETAKSVPVYISEYTMPEEGFEIVGEWTRCGHLSSTNNGNYVTERLYKARPIED